MTSPVDRTARLVSPRSIPTSLVLWGSGVSATLTTHDGTEGRARDHTKRTSPTFATRTPPVVMPKPLRVNRIDCRLSLRDRNLGCPTLRPLRAPDRESNQFRYARRASWHACTKTTDATSPSHCRAGVVLARGTTLRCTCVSLIFSPAA